MRWRETVGTLQTHRGNIRRFLGSCAFVGCTCQRLERLKRGGRGSRKCLACIAEILQECVLEDLITRLMKIVQFGSTEQCPRRAIVNEFKAMLR